MPVPAVLAWHGRSFIYLRQLVQKRGGGEATPWEEGEHRDFADCRTLCLPHPLLLLLLPLPQRSLAFFRHDSTRLTMGIWVVERLMLVSNARGQPRISTLEPGKFNGRPRKWLERRHRFGKINQRLLGTWKLLDFAILRARFLTWNSFFGEKCFIPEQFPRAFRGRRSRRSVQNGTYVVSSNKCLQASHKRHLYLFIWSTKPLYTIVETTQSIVNAALLSLSRHVSVDAFEADDTTVRKKQRLVENWISWIFTTQYSLLLILTIRLSRMNCKGNKHALFEQRLNVSVNLIRISR